VFAGEAPRGAWQHSTVVRVGAARCRVHTREGEREGRVGQVALIVAIIKVTKVTKLTRPGAMKQPGHFY
jgi:hypothetical protein